MRLVVTRRATRRIREIAAYIKIAHPAAAVRVRQAIHDAFALITRYPDIGRLVRPRVRRFSLPRFPYLIFYTVDVVVEEIIIITVRHAAQR